MDKTRKIKKVLISQPTLEGGRPLRRGFASARCRCSIHSSCSTTSRQTIPTSTCPASPASPPRHRDDHLYDPGHGRARRQHGQQRRPSAGRRPVDDGGERVIHQEMPKGGGDAAWRLPALGQPARVQKMMDPRYRDVKQADIPRSSCRRRHGQVICARSARRAAPSGTSSSIRVHRRRHAAAGRVQAIRPSPAYRHRLRFRGSGLFFDEPGLSSIDVEPASYFDLERKPSRRHVGDPLRRRRPDQGDDDRPPRPLPPHVGPPLGESVAWRGPSS